MKFEHPTPSQGECIINVTVEPVPDVLIVGGGVIGLSIAYFLSQSGQQVTVLDQGQPGQEASWAGAGMLPPGNLEGARTASARLRAFSGQRWSKFSRELRELTGIDNGYLESGGLELGFAGEEERLRSEADGWMAEGVTLENLTPSDLRLHEPAVSPAVQSAYRLKDYAQVRNPRHLKALIRACELQNVRVLAGAPVMQFDTESDHDSGVRILAVRTPNERYSAEKFVIAGGAWSGGITRQLKVEIPVRPVRGQMVLLSEAPVSFSHVLNNGPRYLVPRADGRILVGATEEETGFEKRNTVEGVAGLLEFARQMVPGLANARLEQIWSGLRPGSPTGDPFLSRLPRHVNGYVAAGHFRSGLQLSPATGTLMAQLIQTGTTELDLDPFQISDGKSFF